MKKIHLLGVIGVVAAIGAAVTVLCVGCNDGGTYPELGGPDGEAETFLWWFRYWATPENGGGGGDGGGDVGGGDGGGTDVPITPGHGWSDTGFFTDDRNGKTYKTVTIGKQTWMAENLNYTPPSGGNSWCYGEDGKVIVAWTGIDNDIYRQPLTSSEIQANCDTYGRLYDWNTALSVCPNGWHLPSRNEWGDLFLLAGATGEFAENVPFSVYAKLSAVSGWGEGNYSSRNGSDYYKFSALPGGMRQSNGDFWGGGPNHEGYQGDTFGRWWTATPANDKAAYFRPIFNGGGSGGTLAWENGGWGLSVRCLAN